MKKWECHNYTHLLNHFRLTNTPHVIWLSMGLVSDVQMQCPRLVLNHSVQVYCLQLFLNYPNPTCAWSSYYLISKHGSPLQPPRQRLPGLLGLIALCLGQNRTSTHIKAEPTIRCSLRSCINVSLKKGQHNKVLRFQPVIQKLMSK